VLGKILLTVVVIIIAIIVLRQRRQVERQDRPVASRKPPKVEKQTQETGSLGSDMRFVAYALLVLMVGTGTALYYYRWQDDHDVLTVRLYRDGQAQPVIYEVYKYQFGQRSFTTVGGTTVTVAASERMEVEGLED